MQKQWIKLIMCKANFIKLNLHTFSLDDAGLGHGHHGTGGLCDQFRGQPQLVKLVGSFLGLDSAGYHQLGRAACYLLAGHHDLFKLSTAQYNPRKR